MTLTLTPRPVPGAAAASPAPLRSDAGPVTIGRAPDNHLVLPDPASVISSRHCRVDRDAAGGWTLNDISTNGTWINDRRVTGPQPLRSGDVVRIGNYVVDVRLETAAAGMRAPIHAPASDPWQRPAPAAATAPPAAAGGSGAATLCAAAGLRREHVPAPDPVVLEAAGAALRRIAVATHAMTAARARARSELGVAATPHSRQSPATAQTPEQLVAGLLATPPGSAPDPVTAALHDLDAHQRATLTAMQAAFRAALEGFAPAPILRKAGGKPDAAWRLYEQAFSAAGDGFIDLFARELAAAYAKAADTKR